MEVGKGNKDRGCRNLGGPVVNALLFSTYNDLNQGMKDGSSNALFLTFFFWCCPEDSMGGEESPAAQRTTYNSPLLNVFSLTCAINRERQ